MEIRAQLVLYYRSPQPQVHRLLQAARQPRSY
jgi:hypothetical protein